MHINRFSRVINIFIGENVLFFRLVMGWMIVTSHGKKVKLTKGKSLLKHIQELGVHINASCGGQGICRGCLVKVDGTESLSPMTEAEKKAIRSPGYRLACQAIVVRDDLDIYVEVPKYVKILEKGKRKEVPLNPIVKRRATPLGEKVFWGDVEIAPYEGELYGLALDIGTTTVAMRWINLESGEEVFSLSMLNPQIDYGDNVIDRINYARSVGQEPLEKAIRNSINEMVQKGPINPNHIYEMVVVGNTTMRDIFVGHPVKGLGEAPYEPVSLDSVNKKAEELGITINPKANVYALPLIGHFVGADTLAVILATEMHKSSEVTMAIDIGTNTEIAIGNKDKIIVASCASGPAFEGAGVKCGVGAVIGAIQKVKIDSNLKVKYETIGNAPPIGVCGSGLIDALAQMLEKGIMDYAGKLSSGGEFVLAEDGKRIFLDGEDIDNLKLAKAAICAGSKILMRHYGVTVDDIKRLYLAGAFGTYINPENALKIGMLPEIPLERIEKVGNAAIEGATEVLVSEEKRREVEEISKKIGHVRLELEEDFHSLFVESLAFEVCRR